VVAAAFSLNSLLPPHSPSVFQKVRQKQKKVVNILTGCYDVKI